jgi:hypothetical protein
MHCAKFPLQIPFPYNHRIPLKVLNLAIIMFLQTEQLRLKQIILKFLYYSFSTLNALNVHAGPYAAYMVSGKTTNDSNLFTSETKLNTNDFKRFDWFVRRNRR